MTVGEVVLESLTTGVITEAEVGWLASHQESFSRAEEAAAIRLDLRQRGRRKLVQRQKLRPTLDKVQGAAVGRTERPLLC